MASGTYADPYIVKNWSDFEEYNTASYMGKYVKFGGTNTKVINLAIPFPTGVSGLTIYPNIIGNGVHWQRLYVYDATRGINFKGSVEKLYIDGVHMRNILSALELEDSATELYVTCQTVSSNDVCMISRSYDGDLTLTDCQIEFKNQSANARLYGATNDHTLTLKNCEIYYNWDCSEATFENVVLSASQFSGYINADSIVFDEVKQSTTDTYPESLIDMSCAADSISYTGSSSAVCFYNSDKMTFDSTPASWVAVTTATIASETAMNNAGFATGGSSPWNFTFGYLSQDDWAVRDRLGAVDGNTQLFAVNDRRANKNCVIPSSVQSVGRNSFTRNSFRQAELPPACTYYSKSFNIDNIHGGILIE